MIDELNNWPGSVVDRAMLAIAIGKFLRTHRNGCQQLFEWFESVPADMTDIEYSSESLAAGARHEARI